MINFLRQLRRAFRSISFWLFYKKIFENFSCYVVHSEEEKKELYRLRYEVYCLEYKYLDARLYPTGMESDEYDKVSEHLVIRDKEGEIAATVRVIKNSKLNFPINRHFRLDIETPKGPTDNVVEISRLIVAKKYRKKHLIIFLLKGLWLIAIQEKVTHAFCVIDERLYPLLRQLCVPITIVGQKQLYQGVTFPCLIVITEWIEQVRQGRTLQSFFTYRGIEFENGKGKYVIH